MIYYRETDGTLIHKTKSLKEMSRLTGFSEKTIRAKMYEREGRRSRNGGYIKALIPYFERDEFDDTTKDGVNNHFLRLYFAGKTNDEICEDMDIDKKELYRLYRHLIGVDVQPAPPLKQPDGDKYVRNGFWEEWEEAVSVLFKSGKKLDIQITFK